MKDGIVSVDIEPASTQLDFLGATQDPSISEETQTLKGRIRLVITKPIKIKSITVKFKGESTIFQSKVQDQYQYEITSSILPKLKAKLYEKSTTLTPGEHLLPWELEIPNIYPMTYSNKKCNIKYKVQMKMSLGINRTITSNRTILLNRHLVQMEEQSSLFEYTFANGFHYRIQVPKLVYVEQSYIPISVNFNQISGIPIEYISTQIIQVEIYRCRHISNSEADVTTTGGNSNKKNGTITPLFELHRLGDTGLIKYIRSMQPVIKNTIEYQHDYSRTPLLLKHNLEPTLSHDIESPLVAVSHQLEVLFSFGPQYDEVRVKIPVIVSSVPPHSSVTATTTTIETMLHKLPLSVIDNNKQLKRTGSHTSTIEDSIVHQLKDNLTISNDSDITIKKAHSDQDLKEYCPRSRSITPPSTYYATSVKSKKSDETIAATNALMGLHPPPRRTRNNKKDLKLTLSNTRSRRCRSGSHSSSPITPSFSDQLPPLTPSRRQHFLNQSKSTTTTASHHRHSNSTSAPMHMKKRSHSIDHHSNTIPTNNNDDMIIYSTSITSHYVSAELPPIPSPPPAITQQQLPSIPIIVDKSEHRKTRMYYYDDESDEELEHAVSLY